jgi:hypothetical protein
MKGPLSWLLRSTKAAASRLVFIISDNPIVWLFFVGNAVWGLACMTVTRSLASDQDSFFIKAVKWVAGILVLSLPTVVFTLREAYKSDSKYSFEHLIAAVAIVVLVAVLSGFGLEVVLSLLGVRHFLGIPIEKWSLICASWPPSLSAGR